MPPEKREAPSSLQPHSRRYASKYGCACVLKANLLLRVICMREQRRECDPNPFAGLAGKRTVSLMSVGPKRTLRPFLLPRPYILAEKVCEQTPRTHETLWNIHGGTYYVPRIWVAKRPPIHRRIPGQAKNKLKRCGSAR
jgi:hypothetical protein